MSDTAIATHNKTTTNRVLVLLLAIALITSVLIVASLAGGPTTAPSDATPGIGTTGRSDLAPLVTCSVPSAIAQIEGLRRPSDCTPQPPHRNFPSNRIR